MPAAGLVLLLRRRRVDMQLSGKRIRHFISGAALGMSLGTTSAIAADVSTITELEPTVVEGKRIENVKDVKEEMARRPSSVILIPEKDIRESRGSNLSDVLQFAPGV